MDVEDIKSALCLLRHIRHFRVKNEQRRYVTLQAMGVCPTQENSGLTQIFFSRSPFLFLNCLMFVLNIIVDTKIEKT